MPKKIIAIVQARMGSTRLPGKVLMDIEGRPMLWHVVNRLRHCRLLDGIVVATSTDSRDNAVEKFCWDENINLFRGSENDVLDRYYNAAKSSKADMVVRITGDCPLIDPNVVDKTTGALAERSDSHDGSSNIIRRTYPRGLDTEAVSFKTLERCYKEAREGYHREHVTAYIYEHPDVFKMYSVEHNSDLSALRLTVDEKSDLIFIKEIFKRLYAKGKIFYLEDVLTCLQKEPDLSGINKSIKQKSIK